ncbi:MAG: beta-ketoacyl-[acyl-carrier-protein] synthase family protein [Verrucomicrobiota bacterium]|nr:beta-ketoacyl-[acyl-carrier-protein] synthase family protein [Verrucomicrobiota bacterium]
MSASKLALFLRENPIVITGLGAFSATGDTADKLWDAAVVGRANARNIFFAHGETEKFYPAYVGPEIDFSRDELRRLRRLDRCVHMGWLAADEAMCQARLRHAYPADRIGVIIGTARGPMGKVLAAADVPRDKTPLPSVVADNSFTSVSGALARSFGFRGVCVTLAATCASAAVAIAQGAEQILLGQADAVLVGGTEAPLQSLALRQYQAASVLASHENPEQACRPFDADRNGLVLGEGSAVLILESLDSAKKRGATPLARLAGWAYSCNVASRTSTAGEGVVHVVEQALRSAQLKPDAIDYVNLHGTGTRMGDVDEARAMARVFNEGNAGVPCSSTKPITGHCLGATPALEAVISLQALRQQKIPPNANCPNPDPCCQINLVRQTAQPARLQTVMTNSLGFWGQYASLLFATIDHA